MLEKLLPLPRIGDERGSLTFVECFKNIPFKFNRVYWIYDVPSGESRGGHAFKLQEEVIISLSGSFDVVVNDGISERRYRLDRAFYGLYIPNMIWRHMENFSTNSIALVISSMKYDESDYIRDYNFYIKAEKQKVK